MIAGLACLTAACLVGLFLFTFVETKRIEARFPPVGELVETGAGAIHVVERAPDGPERGAVLLVHGASGNFADMSVALADRLAALGFRVFGVDRPGHGWSARMFARAASSPERQARMVREALARRGVAQAVVVVHSLAGVLGLAMALNAPEFVRGLVLVSPVSHPWPGGVAWYYKLAASRALGPLFRRLIVLPAGIATMSANVRGVFDPNPTPPDYIDRTRLALVLRPRHFKANAEDVVDIEAYVAALSPRYGAIRAPTAVVTGDSDGVVYARIHSAGCARDIPGATLTTLRGVGHSPHHCAPESVVAAIVEVDRRANAQAAPPSGPTTAMRRLFVAPGVPKGMPATTITRSPTPTKPSI
jgi:pimeloyl-ACP methyl ester carboxylesterase